MIIGLVGKDKLKDRMIIRERQSYNTINHKNLSSQYATGQ